jgi:hypothetical protein
MKHEHTEGLARGIIGIFVFVFTIIVIVILKHCHE